MYVAVSSCRGAQCRDALLCDRGNPIVANPTVKVTMLLHLVYSNCAKSNRDTSNRCNAPVSNRAQVAARTLHHKTLFHTLPTPAMVSRLMFYSSLDVEADGNEDVAVPQQKAGGVAGTLRGKQCSGDNPSSVDDAPGCVYMGACVCVCVCSLSLCRSLSRCISCVSVPVCLFACRCVCVAVPVWLCVRKMLIHHTTSPVHQPCSFSVCFQWAMEKIRVPQRLLTMAQPMRVPPRGVLASD